jgi:hypothetical protein
MNVDTYESKDIDNNFTFDTGIAGFEISYRSTNKKTMKKTSKKNHIRQKLNSLSEKRFLDRQLNPLSDYWDK